MDSIDFGFRKVTKNSKQQLVQDIFSRVADKYDLMNDVMSLGLHRMWKKALVEQLYPRSEAILLDMAGGTGDIARQFLKSGGKEAVVSDLNPEMLQKGKDKAIDDNFQRRGDLKWHLADAEALPFDDDIFDLYSISFGIRNVTDIPQALREAHRVLKPGGKFACLEFSKVEDDLLAKFYDFYSLNLIPTIGQLITGDREAYQYLVESIRRFPVPDVFASMIQDAGFKAVSFQRHTFGVVAIHTAHKI